MSQKHTPQKDSPYVSRFDMERAMAKMKVELLDMLAEEQQFQAQRAADAPAPYGKARRGGARKPDTRKPETRNPSSEKAPAE